MTVLITSDAGLVAPAAYFGMTAERKAVVCNGAGPKKFGWLVPDTLYGLSITEAANIHDFMYAIGHNRKEADDVFLKNMLTLINERGGFFKHLRRSRAKWYFRAVRWFGGGFYTEV
jgi:hypothetical protein